MGEKTTKEKIFDASLDLFLQKGFNNTSVRQIAHEVGIKKNSIYNHYSTKQANGWFWKHFLIISITHLVEDSNMQSLPESDSVFFYQAGSEIFRYQLRNERIMTIFRFIFIQMYQDEKIAKFFYSITEIWIWYIWL